ncbi:MAG: hypothetical protein QXT45_02990 [Candidatus Bilamarchaeaceae archaeon]
MISKIVIKDEDTILKLRSLGGGVDEEGQISLHPLEAAYFAKRRVIDYDYSKLLKAAGPLAKERYHVLEYLRENGYISKPSFDSDLLRVYNKGFRPGEDRTFCIMKVVKDKRLSPEELRSFCEFAGKLRKEAVIAIVANLEEEPVFIKVSKTKFE